LHVAVGECYLWRSGWAFIMEQRGNVVNKRKRSFYPGVKVTILAVNGFDATPVDPSTVVLVQQGPRQFLITLPERCQR